MTTRAIFFLLLLPACAPAPGPSGPALADDSADVGLTSESDGKDDGAGQVVFLNFGGARLHHGDGCSDAPRGCSALVSGTQDFAPFTLSTEFDRGKTVAAITQCVSQFYSGMNVDFVTTRPRSGSYTMILIGAIYPQQLGFPAGGGPYGRAPVDCGNSNKNDVGFLLLGDDTRPDFYYMCRSIAHELGHTFGLSHTSGPNSVAGRIDAMCETDDCRGRAAGGTPWDFVAEPMDTEAQACDGSNRQNSWRQLDDTLGNRGD